MNVHGRVVRRPPSDPRWKPRIDYPYPNLQHVSPTNRKIQSRVVFSYYKKEGKEQSVVKEIEEDEKSDLDYLTEEMDRIEEEERKLDRKSEKVS